MNTKLVNSAAGVIAAAMANGKQTAAGIACALESAQLLQSPETAQELDRLRAQVAELLAERHTTNEALSDAAERMRADRDRIAELETRYLPKMCECGHSKFVHTVPAPHSCFSEKTQGAAPCGCGEYRQLPLAEAERLQSGRHAARSADAITRRIAPTQALRDDEDVTPQVTKLQALLAGQRAAVEGEHYPTVHHDYRVPRDLPEAGDR